VIRAEWPRKADSQQQPEEDPEELERVLAPHDNSMMIMPSDDKQQEQYLMDCDRDQDRPKVPVLPFVLTESGFKDAVTVTP
jgi:hypothetical protein